MELGRVSVVELGLDSVLIIGGKDPSGANENNVIEVDLVKQTFVREERMQLGKGVEDCKVGRIGNEIVVIGGNGAMETLSMDLD